MSPESIQIIFDFDDSPTEFDKLGFEPAVKNLAKQISETRLPLSIAILGRWGAGKSSFLKQLECELGKEDYNGHFSTVLFEPWKLKNPSNVLFDLISTIHLELTKTKNVSSDTESNAKEKELFKCLEEIRSASILDTVSLAPYIIWRKKVPNLIL